MPPLTLDIQQVIDTAERLHTRICDRFPASGLSQVCRTLMALASDARGEIERIGRPNLLLRGLAVLAILALAALLATTVSGVGTDRKPELGEFLQATEAATNEMIFLSIGAWFLWSLDLRLHRRRAIRWINRLRDLAHIIDMHQLTKDPDGAVGLIRPTEHSPQRKMSAFDLGRYLDYCAEMLSLLSKLGYLAIARFEDPLATTAATGLEDLTSGLSRKIWQKIMILHALPIRAADAPKGS